jgi:cell division inhibitor SepF
VGVMNKFMNFLGLQDMEEVVERYEDQDENETAAPEARKNKNNIVSIHSQKNTRVILCEPRSYEDTQAIADHLRARRSCIVNLQRVQGDLGGRIVDFLSGTVYALSGNISKIGPRIFLCAPDTVEIQGAITEMLDNQG